MRCSKWSATRARCRAGRRRSRARSRPTATHWLIDTGEGEARIDVQRGARARDGRHRLRHRPAPRRLHPRRAATAPAASTSSRCSSRRAVGEDGVAAQMAVVEAELRTVRDLCEAHHVVDERVRDRGASAAVPAGRGARPQSRRCAPRSCPGAPRSCAAPPAARSVTATHGWRRRWPGSRWRTRSGWRRASTRTGARSRCSARWASVTSRSARSPPTRPTATPSRACSGSRRTAASSSPTASPTTARRSCAGASTPDRAASRSA